MYYITDFMFNMPDYNRKLQYEIYVAFSFSIILKMDKIIVKIKSTVFLFDFVFIIHKSKKI